MCQLTLLWAMELLLFQVLYTMSILAHQLTSILRPSKALSEFLKTMILISSFQYMGLAAKYLIVRRCHTALLLMETYSIHNVDQDILVYWMLTLHRCWKCNFMVALSSTASCSMLMAAQVNKQQRWAKKNRNTPSIWFSLTESWMTWKQQSMKLSKAPFFLWAS